MDDPVIDKEDARTIQLLLADILAELQRHTRLMEDDGGEEEEGEQGAE